MIALALDWPTAAVIVGAGFAFLTLRMDSHAQQEIQDYANAVGRLIAREFPRTWELFVEGMK